jgi:hypothetical protein
VTQIMVPLKFRERVMKVAHDGLLSGHFGNRKTLERISAHFYFPGIHETVKRYVWSCDICQRNISKGRVVKCPMGRITTNWNSIPIFIPRYHWTNRSCNRKRK